MQHRSQSNRANLSVSVAVFVGLSTLGLVGGLLAASQAPNVDNSWLLIATGRFMDGAVIGRDLFETNPPLIYWLMMPAVVAARWLQTDSDTTYCLWVGFQAAISMFMVFRIFVLSEVDVGRAALAASILLILFVLVTGPALGQRDPHAFLLAAPFIMAEAVRSAGQRIPIGTTIIVTFFAAIGFLIKPYFELVPATLFVWRIVRERNLLAVFSVDVAIIVVTAALYIAYILLFTPDYLGLAKLMVVAYPAYNSAALKLVVSFVPALIIIAGLWFSVGRLTQPPTSAVVRCLLIVALAFFAGAFTQQKGWYYHLLPGNLTICAACVAYGALQPGAASVWARPRLIVLGIVMLFTIGGVARANYFQRGKVADDELAKIIRKDDNGGPVLAISSSMNGVFPDISESHVSWASHSPMQWMVPATVALEHGTEKQRHDADELRVIATRLITSDLKQWKPYIVVIKTGDDQAMTAPFDWLSFYRNDATFSALWSDYCAFDHTPNWAVYRRCVY